MRSRGHRDTRRRQTEEGGRGRRRSGQLPCRGSNRESSYSKLRERTRESRFDLWPRTARTATGRFLPHHATGRLIDSSPFRAPMRRPLSRAPNDPWRSARRHSSSPRTVASWRHPWEPGERLKNKRPRESLLRHCHRLHRIRAVSESLGTPCPGLFQAAPISSHRVDAATRPAAKMTPSCAADKREGRRVSFSRQMIDGAERSPDRSLAASKNAIARSTRKVARGTERCRRTHRKVHSRVLSRWP